MTSEWIPNVAGRSWFLPPGKPVPLNDRVLAPSTAVEEVSGVLVRFGSDPIGSFRRQS
jgi:hypothetical protein